MGTLNTQPQDKKETFPCPVCEKQNTKKEADISGLCLDSCADEFWIDPMGTIHPSNEEDYDPAAAYI